MRQIYTLMLAAITLLYSCKSANKAFEKGNYEDAVSLAVKQLQKNGGDESTRFLLKDAYQRAVNGHESIIRTLSNGNSDSRYEQMYNEYRKLQNLYESVSRSPEASRVVNAMDYSSYVQTYKEKTGEVYFEKGLALMEQGDKLSYRKAYQQLSTAYRFKPDSQVKQKMDEAYEGAVTRVLLLADNNNYGSTYNSGGMYGNNGMYGNGYHFSNSYQVRNFQEDLVRNLRYQGGSQFVKFVTEWEARSSDVQPDEVVEMRLGRMDMGRSYDETDTRNVSKQVVVRTIVYRPDSVVNEYATVYATIRTTRRNYISDGELNIIAKDGSGRYLWSDVVRGEHRFTREFATFTGDERALSASDKALVSSQSQNGYNNVRNEDIFREVLRQIEAEAAQRFRSYYSRYY
jgi:hypothetical protein